MRDPERVPMILNAIRREWPESHEQHLGAFLMETLNAKGWPWHPLYNTWDARLIELLAEAWTHVDLNDALSATKSDSPWVPVNRAVLFTAIEAVWASLDDFRLGQTIHIAFRQANPDLGPHALFNIEDGATLSAIGGLTAAEKSYVQGEPRAKRRGWAEWERSFHERQANEPG